MTVTFDRATLSKLSVRDLRVLIWRQKWLMTARPKQLPPDISDHGNGIDPEWTEWGLLSGRNFGKTLCGSHWLGHEALTDAGPKENNLSFVIAPTLSDVRYTCFEGPTGLITTMPQEVIADYNRTNLIITLDNGGIIRGFSAEEPERLRGPQAARAWCDELAAWGGTGGGGERVADETWNMMMFGLRLGPRPRIIWTTTPKPKELVRRLSKPKPRRHITTGSSDENRANTPDSYFEQLDQYAGTRLERQERFGEIIDDEEGAIISKGWLRLWPAKKTLPKFDFIVASFDTAFTDASLDVRSHVPDPTACGVFGAFWNPETQREEILVLDVWDEHLGFPDLLPKAKAVMKQGYGDDQDLPMLKPMFGPGRATQGPGVGRKPDIMLVEDKGSGISMRQMLEREGIPLYRYNPGNADKAARLHMVSHIFAQKMVWVPESTHRPGKFANWADSETKKDGRTGWLTQIVTFKGKNSIRFDDYVDVTSQALRLLIEKQIVTGIKQTSSERAKERDFEDNPPPKNRGNPYAQ